MHGVSQGECSGQQLNCSASKASNIVNGRLNHLITVTDEVTGLRSDLQCESLFPIRFKPFVAIGGAGISNGRVPIGERAWERTQRNSDGAQEGSAFEVRHASVSGIESLLV